MFPQKHTTKGLFYAYIQKVIGLGVFAFLFLDVFLLDRKNNLITQLNLFNEKAS